MSSISAKNNCSKQLNVVFLAYPELKLLDLTGPLQVFSDAVLDTETETPAYQVTVVSVNGGLVKTDTSIPITSTSLAQFDGDFEVDTLIVPGGRGSIAASKDQQLLEAASSLIAQSSRIASVCSGAFILAEAGVLDNRRAVTHWQSCEFLAERFPKVKVESDPIYIRDGNIWTSAGVTAGIDLALAMVGEDLGRQPALALARRLVAYMVRPGGQSQFSDVLKIQSEGAERRFDPLVNWISDNIDQDLRVEVLAEKANMSPRNFARKFHEELGYTPAKMVEAIRIDKARNLLEESTLPIKSIARRCGFDDDERMRRAFVRKLNIAPNEYRQRF
ncbi:MAG: GlxA family transcriptional regulator [Pseudomonadota bacterium]